VLVVLAATILVSDAFFSVTLPSGATVTVSSALHIAVLLLAGPTAMAVLFMIVAVVSRVIARVPPVRIVFNGAQVAVSSLVAGWTFVYISQAMGIQLPGGLLDSGSYPAMLLPLAVAAVVFTAVNATLVTAALTLAQGVPFWRVWTATVGPAAAVELVGALLGLALAQVLAIYGLFGLVLFLVPLLVARGIYQSYISRREAYADTLRGLVAAIEAKDVYTRGHSERVTAYATSLARSMRLPDSTVQRIELAALLHDLGKVGISRRILLKPGRLDEVEWQSVRQHPAIAAEIISSVDFLAETLPAIIHHHERWDGGGYSDGLSGQQIPMDARILAVADAYDAMTSSRPYRQSRSPEEAVQEILNGSAGQFDPTIAKAFVAMLREDGVLEPEARPDVGMGVARAEQA
jgi:HD-GYP domain-containing protein (c-di-GMP phosphodiesterase class II)